MAPIWPHVAPYGPGSTPSSNTILLCELSLLSVLFSALRGLSVLNVSLAIPSKNQHSQFQFDLFGVLRTSEVYTLNSIFCFLCFTSFMNGYRLVHRG